MCSKMAAILDFWPFGGHKRPKSKIFKIATSDLCNVIQGRYIPNFKFLAFMVSKCSLLEIAVKVCAHIVI